MRILFTTWAWRSHLYALAPLAWACRAAGHDVRIASQPGLLETIAATGLPGVAVGRDVDVLTDFRTYTVPPQRPVGAGPGGPGAGGPGAGGPGAGGPGAGGGGRPRALQTFVGIADAMADDLVAFARAWRPDLVIFEPTAWAGPLAAAAVGVPSVRQLYGLDLLFRAGEHLPAMLEPLRARVGVGPIEPLGTVTADPCPVSLQTPTVADRLPFRHVPFNGGGEAPGWLLEPPSRPRVCVTWGTTMARLDPSFFLVDAVIDAIRELPVEIVAAVTPAQAALLGPVPDNVRVAVGVPLHVLLPTCDLVVAHGGAGTALTALASGVPQLAVPRLPDHAAHGTRVAAVGAGQVIPRDEEPTAERIVQAVKEILADKSYGTAARRLQTEMAEQQPIAELVEKLTTLT